MKYIAIILFILMSFIGHCQDYVHKAEIVEAITEVPDTTQGIAIVINDMKTMKPTLVEAIEITEKYMNDRGDVKWIGPVEYWAEERKLKNVYCFIPKGRP